MWQYSLELCEHGLAQVLSVPECTLFGVEGRVVGNHDFGPEFLTGHLLVAVDVGNTPVEPVVVIDLFLTVEEAFRLLGGVQLGEGLPLH